MSFSVLLSIRIPMVSHLSFGSIPKYVVIKKAPTFSSSDLEKKNHTKIKKRGEKITWRSTPTRRRRLSVCRYIDQCLQYTPSAAQVLKKKKKRYVPHDHEATTLSKNRKIP